MKTKNVLMWIPIIGIITGFIDVISKDSWFDKASYIILYINGIYNGIMFVMILHLFM